MRGNQVSVEQALCLLIESSVLYSAFWIITFISVFAGVHATQMGTPYVTMLLVMTEAMPQIVCIYPTVLIIGVCLQSSEGGSKALFSAPMPKFACAGAPGADTELSVFVGGFSVDALTSQHERPSIAVTVELAEADKAGDQLQDWEQMGVKPDGCSRDPV